MINGPRYPPSYPKELDSHAYEFYLRTYRHLFLRVRSEVAPAIRHIADSVFGKPMPKTEYFVFYDILMECMRDDLLDFMNGVPDPFVSGYEGSSDEDSDSE